jgi:two-component system, sensor histidine kinase YesM
MFLPVKWRRNMKERLKGLTRVYKDLSIKRKLLLTLYIQIFIPLILIGYMSYKISTDIIQEKSMAYSQDILHMIQLRLKDYAHNLKVISQDLIYDRKIYSVLEKDSNPLYYDEKNEEGDALIEYEDDDTVNNILKKIIQARNEIQAISFVSSTGKNYSFDNNSKKSSIKDIAPYDKILGKARKAKGEVVWYLDCKGKVVENIYMARTIYNEDNFVDEIGLMVILVKKEFLESVYQDLETKNMHNVSILSENNELIVSRNPDSTYLSDIDFKDIKKPVIDKKAGLIISYVSINEPGWKVITYISLKDMNREINLLREWIVLFSIISVLILSIIGTIIAIDFINPINKLVKGMQKIQKGESDVHVEVDRKDELGFLSKTFNKMSAEIHHLVNWIYREQITRKEAEIKALQSQINPHFLFNTLESINWMAQLNNVPEISETVSELSSLMEASIGRDDKLITIEEEFNYADKYISLIKRRFEDRIEFKKEVEKETLKVKIPRLLIQPLIENAVYHGVESCREKGIINLNTILEDQVVVIEVIDNGMGIDRDDLEQLNDKLAMSNDAYFKSLASKKNKSIGIENVNRRIKLFYGENYGLQIESEPGSYTKVIVRIPLYSSEKREGYYVQGIDS